MASRVELEYPLVGSSVGFSFSAGGDFDWSRAVLARPIAGPHKIRCVLTSQTGLSLAAADVVIASSGAFPWSVNLSVPPPTDGSPSYPNCSITATHLDDMNNPVAGDAEAATGITVGNGAPGHPQPGGTIVILPPP